MSGFQYWWDTLPGDSLYVFSFEVDPSEFNKLLANHSFVQSSNPDYIGMQHRDNFLGLRWAGMNIQLPRSFFCVM
jgi:hypothetical protein